MLQLRREIILKTLPLPGDVSSIVLNYDHDWYQKYCLKKQVKAFDVFDHVIAWSFGNQLSFCLPGEEQVYHYQHKQLIRFVTILGGSCIVFTDVQNQTTIWDPRGQQPLVFYQHTANVEYQARFGENDCVWFTYYNQTPDGKEYKIGIFKVLPHAIIMVHERYAPSTIPPTVFHLYENYILVGSESGVVYLKKRWLNDVTLFIQSEGLYRIPAPLHLITTSNNRLITVSSSLFHVNNGIFLSKESMFPITKRIKFDMQDGIPECSGPVKCASKLSEDHFVICTITNEIYVIQYVYLASRLPIESYQKITLKQQLQCNVEEIKVVGKSIYLLSADHCIYELSC